MLAGFFLVGVSPARAQHSVTLKWTNPQTPETDSGVTITLLYNNVYRSTDGVNFSAICCAGTSFAIGPMNTFVDQNITLGTTYYYYVTAVFGGGTNNICLTANPCESRASHTLVVPTSSGVGKFVSHTEQLATADSLATSQVLRRTLSETLTTNSTLTASFVGSATMTHAEDLTTSDMLARTAGTTRAPSETLSTSDALTPLHARSAPLTETLSTSDALARSATLTRSIAESLSTSAPLAVSSPQLGIFGFSEDLRTSDSLAVSMGTSPPSISVFAPF